MYRSELEALRARNRRLQQRNDRLAEDLSRVHVLRRAKRAGPRPEPPRDHPLVLPVVIAGLLAAGLGVQFLPSAEGMLLSLVALAVVAIGVAYPAARNAALLRHWLGDLRGRASSRFGSLSADLRGHVSKRD